MTVTEHGSDSLVHGIAEFYGRRQAVETGLRVLLFGKHDAENFREEQRMYADEALQRIEPRESAGALNPALDERNGDHRNGARAPAEDGAN